MGSGHIVLELWCVLSLFMAYSTVISALEARSEIPSHVCVIGAGYSGLATARYLQRNGLNFTVFEATRQIGGTWAFNPYVCTDIDGLPVYTSMYKHLRTNTPCQTMEFTGFPFPANTTSFVSAACFLNYIHSFVREFDLMKFIQLRSAVSDVKWTKDHWQLTYTDTKAKRTKVTACDFVAVCNGHRFSKPRWPNFPGLQDFGGYVIHSHDYKRPEPYFGRKVLIVGAGNSGLDLATYLTGVADTVVHSHHRIFNDTMYPDNYIKKPDIDSFTSDGVLFVDGSYEDIDDVIFCTGYLFDHPFLAKSTEVVATSKYVMPLYQHAVNILHPTMTFVGLSKKVYPRMMDRQAEYVAALAAKKFKLPSQAEMMMKWFSDMETLEANGKNITDTNDLIDVEYYIDNLSAESGIESAPSVIFKMRKDNELLRLEDWYHFREYDYQVIDDDNYEMIHNPENDEHCPIHF